MTNYNIYVSLESHFTLEVDSIEIAIKEGNNYLNEKLRSFSDLDNITIDVLDVYQDNVLDELLGKNVFVYYFFINGFFLITSDKDSVHDVAEKRSYEISKNIEFYLGYYINNKNILGIFPIQ